MIFQKKRQLYWFPAQHWAVRMSEDSLNSYGSDSYGTESESDDGNQELSSWQRLKQRINNKSTIQAPTTNFGGTGTFTMEHLEQHQSNSPRVREGYRTIKHTRF